MMLATAETTALPPPAVSMRYCARHAYEMTVRCRLGRKTVRGHG